MSNDDANSAAMLNDDANSAFLCPINQTIMTDPVSDPEGNSYERSAIMQWLQRNQTSPVTRNPLTPANLVPNRALQYAIEQYKAMQAARATSSAAAPTASQTSASEPEPEQGTSTLQRGVSSTAAPQATEADIAADGSVLIETSTCPGPDQTVTVMASMVPPTGTERAPCDVCCVVDVSGSMGADATMRGGGGALESHGLSLLDIVKHAVSTIIGVLGEHDRLSLVAYSSESRVVFDLINMDDSGKARAKRELASLAPGGQTNLWDGLHSGLEVLKAGSNADSHRLSAVFLLTDGQPNIAPPRGHLPMLRRYKDQNQQLSATITTFGFGYRLDSELLQELAVEGDGMYAFIPDSGAVGTCFVNALSNLLVTMGTNASLAIEPIGGATIIPDGIPGGLPRHEASWGVELKIGALQYGQAKHCLVKVQLPADFTSGTPFLQLTLNYETRHSPEKVTCEAEVSNQNDPGVGGIPVQLARLELVDCLTKASSDARSMGGTGPEVQALLASYVEKMKASGQSGDFFKDMLKDAEGQATMALQNAEFYHRWGCHYLPSLARAHQLEQCNNFKDPGIQHYGGQLFESLRDFADDLFCKLPPPQPSQRRTSSYGPPSTAVPRAPINMSAYNNASNPCFAGHCQVLMADGTLKAAEQVVCGDLLCVASGGSTTVRCVVKTLCAGGVADLVQLPGGLAITPWHPVQVHGDAWNFPCTLEHPRPTNCPAIYSYVLESEHIMIVDGVRVVTLGHGLTTDDVVSHPYFGTSKVIDDLSRMRGWRRGLVLLNYGCLVRATPSDYPRFDCTREIANRQQDLPPATSNRVTKGVETVG